jgi:succinate dehydrogenase / fumarate reductase cytochrome b subunit
MRYHPYHAPLQPSDLSPLRRAFSLSGVLPLGAFLVFHLSVLARGLSGDAALARAIDALHASRGLGVIEVAFVYVPLLVHGAIGVRLVVRRDVFVEPSPYSPPAMAALRATGMVAAVFLLWHLWDLGFGFRGSRADGGTLATLLAARLSSTRFGIPWRGVAYLFAVGCVVFHFVAGAWGVYARSPRGHDYPRRRRNTAILAGALGVVLTVGYANVVVFESTGKRLFGGKSRAEQPTPGCP